MDTPKIISQALASGRAPGAERGLRPSLSVAKLDDLSQVAKRLTAVATDGPATPTRADTLGRAPSATSPLSARSSASAAAPTPPSPRSPAAGPALADRQAVAALGQQAATDVDTLVAHSRATDDVTRFTMPRAGGTVAEALRGGPQGPQGGVDPAGWRVGDPDAMLAGNRGGVGLTGTPQVGGGEQILRGGMDITAASLGVGHIFGLAGGGTVNVAADAFGARAFGGVAPSVMWKPAAGEQLGGSLGVVALGQSEMTVLAPYGGDDPKLSGSLLTELKQTRMVGVALDIGGITHHFGIGAKVGFARQTQTTVQRYVPREELGGVMIARGGRLRALRAFAEGLGLRRPPIASPKLGEVTGDNVRLEVGEMLSVTVSRQLAAGLTVGSYGVRAGVAGNYTGQMELTLRRLDATHVELIVAPRRSMSLSANLDALAIGEVSPQSTLGLSLRQGFEFDLSTPAGRNALTRALRGELPSDSQSVRPLRASDLRDLGMAVRHEAMPPSVGRTFGEKAEILVSRVGAGAPRPFFLSAPVAGLGFYRSAFEKTHVATQGDASVEAVTHGSEKESQRGLGGTKRTAVSGTLIRVLSLEESTPQAPIFGGVRLETKVTMDRVRGQSRRAVGRKLRDALGLPISNFHARGRAQSYEVQVTRSLDEAALSRLANAGAQPVAAAADASGAARRPLAELVDQLHATPSVEARGRLVLAYVARERTHGMGAVHRLAGGGPEQLEVRTGSSAYDRPANAAVDIVASYGDRADALTAGQRRAALVRIDRLLRELHVAQVLVNDDQVLRASNPDLLVERLNTLGTIVAEVRALRRTLTTVAPTA